MILLDAHVHIYDSFNLDEFFDAALSNFQKAAKRFQSERNFSFFLLLSETLNENWFQRLSALAAPKNQPGRKPLKKWTIHPTAERISLVLKPCGTLSGSKIFVIAGRQIVTDERLEVLSLLSDSRVEDGKSLDSTIYHVIEGDGIPVIPWGAGKWFGKRGRVVKNFLRKHTESNLLLSDTGSRPKIWPTPFLFRYAQANGFLMLRGTDPLPLSLDMFRVGNYGAYLFYNCMDDNPGAYLKKILKDRKKRHIGLYGERQRTLPFIANQLTMMFKRGTSH